MKLPQLPQQPIRHEVELEDKEIWQPSWNCFCCEDTGRVTPHNARLVIPGYDYDRDRLPICQSPGCDKHEKWLHFGNNNIDMRFTSVICQQLDMQYRENWRRTAERKAVDLKTMTKKMAMRGVISRTSNDDREIQQRKAEIEAITSEQWLAIKDEYQRGKKNETS